MPTAENATWFFGHLQILTTMTGIFAFLISCYATRASEGSGVMSLGRAATWCVLPNGIAFLICSADSSYVPKIADSSAAFLMGGLALVAMCLYDARQLAKGA